MSNALRSGFTAGAGDLRTATRSAEPVFGPIRKCVLTLP